GQRPQQGRAAVEQQAPQPSRGQQQGEGGRDGDQPPGPEGEAEGAEAGRHQPVGQGGLVEEVVTLVPWYQPVPRLHHGPRDVHEVDLRALEGGRPQGGQEDGGRGGQEQAQGGRPGQPGRPAGAQRAQGTAGAGTGTSPRLRWSWPQAARMSWPRGRRTETRTRASERIRQNSSTAARVGGANGISGAGLRGMRFTLPFPPASSRASAR